MVESVGSGQVMTVHPIGWVRGGRATHDDDYWGGSESRIELDETRFGAESLAGLTDFSHVVVVYVCHLVDEATVEIGARRPRGRADWPLVGIFAQRAKRRPNRLGVTTCRILRVDRTVVVVEGLDAMEGTPVLDLKPHLIEFGPRGPVCQPDWAGELMADYFLPRPGA